MKIALAQIRTIKGKVDQNIQNHLRFIEQAVAQKADLVLFPELSITGYEPELAAVLACTSNDPQFDVFQEISNQKNIIIGVGMPILKNKAICISLLIFSPHQNRQVYTKKYLHADEVPFFKAGQNASNFIKNTSISLAICYEIFVKDHAKKAGEDGATIYLASVAKSEKGVKKAYDRLSKVAKNKKMLVLMCNNIGYCDNFEAKGLSAAWNKEGRLIGQLKGDKEGLLVIDTVN